MTVAEKAAQFAVAIANDNTHGYDQGNRWGPDYDCSSLVISAYKAAGVPLSATYTGNLWRDALNHGFFVPSGIDLQTGAGLEVGDILLNEKSHAAIYVGNGQIVNAGGNELGGTTGGQPGDQTGREIAVRPYYNYPWDVVLRLREEKSPDGTYIVQTGDTLWSIAEKLLGDPWRYHELEVLNKLSNAMIYPGQVLKLPVEVAQPEKVTLTVTVDRETAQLLDIMAAGWGKSVGEVIDKLMEDAR